jgi:NAD(P)-dependent dehydrogenase (short-subunit alcohol dehydrogenase family)
MQDLVITGATRGIGRALALAAASDYRRVVVGRHAAAVGALVRELAQRGLSAEAVFGDLSSIAASRSLGERLARVVRPGATLVHNAGVWPARLTRNPDGYEASFMVNTAAPTLLQESMLRAGSLGRILVIGAGAMVKGRFDADRTPRGDDFSALRTYCDTKLGQATAMRATARAFPEVDVAVVHPGVVRTDLGARPGITGWLLRQVKRSWEAPEVCGERLARVLARRRWAPAPGEARWMVEEREESWPVITDWVAEAVGTAITHVCARRV